MDIYWGGQAFFKIKGKNSSVIIDPFDPEFIGLKSPKDLTADMVLLSHNHQDHNFSGSITTQSGAKPMVFADCGEYEIGGIIATGISSFHDNSQGMLRGKNIIYHLMVDGLNIVHLGDLGQSKLTEEQISAIGAVDILLIPVGSIYTIDAKTAAGIVSQLEPKITIPMHYKIEGLKFDLEDCGQFLKEMGAESAVPLPKLSMTKDKLPEEPMVVVLSKS